MNCGVCRIYNLFFGRYVYWICLTICIESYIVHILATATLSIAIFHVQLQGRFIWDVSPLFSVRPDEDHVSVDHTTLDFPAEYLVNFTCTVNGIRPTPEMYWVFTDKSDQRLENSTISTTIMNTTYNITKTEITLTLLVNETYSDRILRCVVCPYNLSEIFEDYPLHELCE